MKRTKNSNTYTKVLKLIDHYKAIGTTEYELSQTDKDLPWDKVVRFEYLHIDNFIFFTEPINGIEFCWEIYLGWEDNKVKNRNYEVLLEKLNSNKVKNKLISKLNVVNKEDIKHIKSQIKDYTKQLNFCLDLKATYNKK